MPPIDTADATAARVEQSLRDQGATSAAQILSKEFADYASTHDASQTNAYWNKVSTKLSNDNVLVDLAIVWAKNRKDDISRDGDMTPFDLKQVDRWSDASALDRGMASTLLKNFASLKKEHADPVGTTFGFGGTEKDAITQQDVQSRMDRVETARKERVDYENKVADARTNMKSLVATKDGDPNHSLLSALDHCRGGVVDGRVSSEDLKRYLAEYKVRELTGEKMDGEKYNPETKKSIESLLQRWDSPSVQRLKDGDSITADSLAKAGGFKTKAELVAHFKTTA